MKKTILLASLLLSFLLTSAGAEFGASGWTIFKKIHSAQFGGISAASIKADLSGMLYNPAILETINMRQVMFVSEKGLADDKFGGILYGQPIRNGMLAAAFAYYDAGMAELNWLDGGALKSDTVSAQKDMMGMVSYQHKASKILSLGISLKGASSELAQRQTATGFAADAGMFLTPVNNFSISLAAQNIGFATKFIEKANPLPTGGYLGFGYYMQMRSAYIATTAGLTYLVNEEKTVPEVGIECGWGPVSLNAGYRNITGDLNYHIGFQIAYKDLVFGYAFMPAVDLDSIHRLSVTYRFKTAPAKTKPKTVSVTSLPVPQLKASDAVMKFKNK